MSRILSTLVGFCILATVFAQRNAYICGVLYDNFCPDNSNSCPVDPVLHFGGNAYGFEHFNLVSFDSIYATSGDVQGRIAIRNNAVLTAFSVGYELKTGGITAWDISLPYSAVIGGNANWNGGAILPDGSNFPYMGAQEFLFVGGAFTGSSYLLTGSGSCPGNVAGCLNADFDNAQAYYNQLSAGFATLPVNTQFTLQTWGTITLSCNSGADAQYVLNLTPDQFSSINDWELDTASNCNPQSQLVVNIQGTGSQVRFWGATQNLFNATKTLYNVVPSSATPAVRVEVGVNGNLLASSSQYNQPHEGVFIGIVIVANVVETLQINLNYCPTPNQGGGHNNDTSPPLCPAWETDCEGLDLVFGQSTYSYRDFNVISFGSFSANTGDIEGRLAVEDDCNLGSGYSIGYELQTSTGQPDVYLPYSLICGGDLTWGSGALYPDGTGYPYPGEEEDIFVGGTANAPQYLAERITGTCGGSPGCLDATFNAAQVCYNGYQSTMSTNTDNVVSTIEFSGLAITCNDANADAYYVTITASQFSQFTYTTLDNCNFQATWTINVPGTDNVEITGGSFPAIPGGVVYNVLGCGRVIYIHDTALSGSLLSPCNTLNQTNGVITGKVVVGDVAMSLQINAQNSCPEPTTVIIPVVVNIPSIRSSILSVDSNSLRTGDVVKLATVVGDNGDNTYVLDHEINTNANEVIYVNANSLDSRTPTVKAPSSSGSIVAVTVALIIAALAF